MCGNPKLVSNWIMGPLLGRLNASGASIEETPVSAAHLGEMLVMIDKGTISGKIGKSVFDEMAAGGKAPAQIVEEKGLTQVSDSGAIEAVVADILSGAPDEVAAYRAGKTKLMGFFVGQVMKATRGKANPKLVNQILQQKLSEPDAE